MMYHSLVCDSDAFCIQFQRRKHVFTFVKYNCLMMEIENVQMKSYWVSLVYRK